MCYNADDMREINTTSASFRDFVENGDIYVDKTEYIYKLVSAGRRFYFISRPRRYGKSLFCSTLHALFDGKKDLFRGLYIAERTDYSFERFPVIHLNFALISTSTYARFEARFAGMIREAGKAVDVEVEGDDPAAMLEGILRGLGGRAVIIIDEFDAPLVDSMDTPYVGDMRRVFNEFYSTIKNCGGLVRFLFITGVTKLSNLSIFSKMNNLVDLSMDPRFASAFGYTDEELLEYFGEGIDEYYSSHRDEYASRDEFALRIREYYDGYRFSPRSEVTVYNPVSIGYFFNDGCSFQNYWNMTGISRLAVDLAMRVPLSEFIEGDASVPLSAFTSFDISQIYEGRLSRESVLALLYYTGYLTIRTAKGERIRLAFPNMEVATSFSTSLVTRYRDTGTQDVTLWLCDLIDACEEGDEEAARRKMEEYFAAFSYELADRDPERTYHAIFHSIFVMAGLDAISEDRGALKVDGSADEALSQIEARDYGKRYAYLMRPGMVLHKVGISFSSADRRISDWKSL